MLLPDYRRLYHYHLKKTGGSTFNQWLDTLTAAERIFDYSWVEPSWHESWLMTNWRDERSLRQLRRDDSGARAVFHWSDVVHTHKPLRPLAPPGTLCFTVLRDPVQRLLSQVSDWRRLSAEDIASISTDVKGLVEDAGRLPLRDYLQRYSRLEGRMVLDNYVTRALAASRLGQAVLLVDDTASILDIAMTTLENDFQLVGLTEEFDLTRNALCAIAGLPPAREISYLNRSRAPQAHSHEISDAHYLLDSLTCTDRILYQRACELFDDRHRAAGEAYDTETFESRHASRLLQGMRGVRRDEATCYSVRSPIIGSGFHGRDDAAKPTCAVWSGPSTCLSLYMPVPPDMQLSIVLWIRGYAVARQRDQIAVRVDGKAVRHQFITADGCADLLTVDPATTERDFVRLDVEVDETVTSSEAGSECADPRKRGICFDGYGWRL